jgi:hypothetical protein
MSLNPCHRAIECNFYMINPVPVQVNSNLLETHSSEGHLEKLGLSINIKAWLKFYHRHITAIPRIMF